MLRLLVCAILAAPSSAPDPGDPPLRVRRIALEGLHTVVEEELAREVAPLLPRDRLRRGARAALAARVQSALAEALRRRGLLDARVVVGEDHPGEQARFVLLRAVIREGPRYRVGALEVLGLGRADRLEALHRLVLRSGQLLALADVESSRDAVATLLADRGHAFVRVTAGLARHAREPFVDATFTVVPGERAAVRAVEVRGASRTGEQLVRQALILRPGAAYHRSTLRGGVARLRRSEAFERVELAETRAGPGAVRLVVTVRERPLRPASRTAVGP